jgi:hypothetical protein
MSVPAFSPVSSRSSRRAAASGSSPGSTSPAGASMHTCTRPAPRHASSVSSRARARPRAGRGWTLPIGGRNWAMSSTSSARPAARSTGSTATALASCTLRQPHTRLRGPLLRAGAMAGLREGLQAAPRSRGLSQGAAPHPTCAARPRGRRTCRQPARRGELSPRSRVQPAAWGARRKGAAGAHEMEISSSQGVAATKSLRVTLAADAVTAGSSRLPMKRSAAGGAWQESVGLRTNGWRGWGCRLEECPAGFAAFRRAHVELSGGRDQRGAKCESWSQVCTGQERECWAQPYECE